MTEPHPIPNNPRFKDLTGQRFGRLRVVFYAGRPKGETLWGCVCDCGKDYVTYSNTLRSGRCKSCGCWHDEAAKIYQTKHGKSHSPEHDIWCGLRNRCSNTNEPAYKDYGGRGIAVCERWDVFENFLSDMGKRPSRNHSIERIDNDGDYCPENCRWATQEEQCNNRRSSRFVEYDGRNLTVAQWSRVTGISEFVLYYRFRSGWTAKKALETPVRKR